MANHGKKYEEAIKVIEPGKAYSGRNALELAKKLAHAKFDETVELHLNTNLDPKRADQQMRGVVILPYGQGKKVRILVLTQGEAVKAAEKAGADYAGGDELIKKIEEGWLDFDVAIATQDMMGKVSKLGRILGRKGLMPNPKSGTIAAPNDLPRVVSEARKGRVEYRLDRTAVIHVPIGKVSFEEDKLLANLTAVMDAIVKARPSGAKGQYIKSATLSTTMGPGIKLDLNDVISLAS